LEELQAQGFIRARIDGDIVDLDGKIQLDKNKNIILMSLSIALKSEMT
jgi:excinuclease UvrABC ATPase subunit